MTSSYKLDQLKQQVIETSNQQEKLLKRRDKTKELINYQEQEQEQNQEQMVQLVRNIFGQSELSNAMERELLLDKLDKFNHRQTVMNEQLISLNDNITDVTSLKAVYDAKRQELEIDYQHQKSILQKQIKSLEDNLDSHKKDLDNLNQEIKINTSKLKIIIDQINKATFLLELKKTWIDKYLIFIIVGAGAMIIGGICGWGIFYYISNFFKQMFN